MSYENTNTIQATEKPSAVVDRTTMTKAVEFACKVIERRNTIPILANIKLHGDGERLFVTATDLDIELTAGVPSAAGADFQTTIPAWKLKDFLKKARKTDLAAFTDLGEGTDDESGFAVVEFDSVKYKLQSLPVSDFPTLEVPKSNHSFSLSGADLLKLIEGTQPFISTEETRYYLNGIYVHHLDGKLIAVATDGHRLGYQEIDAPEGSEAIPSVIIPRKTIKLVHDLIKGKSTPDSVNVQIEETKVRISFESAAGFPITITSKNIDGTFPDYCRIMPNYSEITIKADAEEFSGAVADCALVSSPRGRAIKWVVKDENRLGFEVQNPDTGTASATIQADIVGVEGFEMGFNSEYIGTMIAVAGAGRIEWAITDAGAPAVITGERDGWKGVVMPMRV